jgi:hypothetical protein
MTKYILTSVHYKGAVQFEYDKAGLMLFYSVLDAELSELQLVGLLKKIPVEERDLQKLNETGYFTVKNLSEDLSFESFWQLYEKKIHPHRCEPLWKKMSDVKRLAAIKAIGGYNYYLGRTGVGKAGPENYLKKEYWKTDWSKEV